MWVGVVSANRKRPQEAAPVRISPRTGKPVRKYDRRTAVASVETPPFLPDQALLRFAM